MLNNLHNNDEADYKGRIFIGTVVANDDPLQIERIKVSIQGLFDGTDPSLLPWVGKREGGPIANQGTAHGSFGLVPRLGDKVFVKFQMGNAQYPLYWKSPTIAGARPAEGNVNYPNRYGWRDPAGNVIFVDITPGQQLLQVNHVSGSSIRIANNGDVTISSVRNLNLTAAQNVLVQGVRIDLNP